LMTMASFTEPLGLNGQILGKLCRALAELQSGAYNHMKLFFISKQMCA
jgi:hypothetical protein